MKEPPCNDSLMFRKHVLEARRHHNTQRFMPKCKTLRQKVIQKCINRNCTHIHYERVIKPEFRPLDDIRTALGLTLTTHDEVVLCLGCYHDVYLHFTIQFLTKGCRCKKGCKSNACGCRKKSRHLGQGVNTTDVRTCQLTMFREVIQMTRVRVDQGQIQTMI